MSTFTDGQILTASQLNAVVAATVPAGVISPYAGASAPANWLLCDGTAVSRSTYSVLFAVTGTQFGVGDGSTTFNLPDLRGRVPVAIDTGQSEFNVRGETGGAKTHTLTSAELPVHAHTTPDHTHDFNGIVCVSEASGHGLTTSSPSFVNRPIVNASSVGGLVVSGGGGTSGNIGSGSAHNNLQPYIALQFIIKT